MVENTTVVAFLEDFVCNPHLFSEVCCADSKSQLATFKIRQSYLVVGFEAAIPRGGAPVDHALDEDAEIDDASDRRRRPGAAAAVLSAALAVGRSGLPLHAHAQSRALAVVNL